MNTNFNWDDLGLDELEDEASVKVRLDAIHKEILTQKGLATVPAKNSPGFAPTPYQARQVAVMAALGLEAKDIALVLDIEESLVKLYYKRELRVTHNLANAMVAREALKMALSGRYPDMTKFWLKTRGGWKEAVATAHDEDKNKEAGESARDKLRRQISDAQAKVTTPNS